MECKNISSTFAPALIEKAQIFEGDRAWSLDELGGAAAVKKSFKKTLIKCCQRNKLALSLQPAKEGIEGKGAGNDL